MTTRQLKTLGCLLCCAAPIACPTGPTGVGISLVLFVAGATLFVAGRLG